LIYSVKCKISTVTELSGTKGRKNILYTHETMELYELLESAVHSDYIVWEDNGTEKSYTCI